MSGAPVFRIDVELRRGTFRRAFDVSSHERALALVGASGSGKTSLLHAVAGLVRPVRGRIEVEGDVLFDSAQRIDVPPPARRIGYVFQDGRLFPHMDVRRNLQFGASARHVAPRLRLEDVVDLLGLGALLSRQAESLSGGEVQRVALGRALLSQPRLLLLDEPLSMIDIDRRDELITYLRRARDEIGLPMLYVSHAPDEVRRVADAVHRLGDASGG